MNNPKLYSVKEAAKIVGVSTNTLYKYLDEDRIHAARGSAIQGRFRIPESALEEFLGVKLSQPTITSDLPVDRSTEPLKDLSTESLTNRLTESPISTKAPRLPLRLIRFLLILALIAMLIDIIVSPQVELLPTLTRTVLTLCLLILAYQEGGFIRK